MTNALLKYVYLDTFMTSTKINIYDFKLRLFYRALEMDSAVDSPSRDSVWSCSIKLIYIIFKTCGSITRNVYRNECEIQIRFFYAR